MAQTAELMLRGAPGITRDVPPVRTLVILVKLVFLSTDVFHIGIWLQHLLLDFRSFCFEWQKSKMTHICKATV